MFMRLVHHKVRPDELKNIQDYYHQVVIPALEKTPGCLSACLIHATQQAEEVISLTLWESPAHVRAYEQSGVFKQLVDGMRPYLAESSEWKIHLSKDLTLEYAAVPEEPVVKTYTVVTASNDAPVRKIPSHLMYTRIVSVKLRPGKMEEYKRLYNELIIPALRETPGCQFAYLIESTEEANEVHSITVWDSKQHADSYEQSGKFAELVDQVKHTFSELYQWKMSLDRTKRERSITSEDLEVTGFSVVTARSFSEM